MSLGKHVIKSSAMDAEMEAFAIDCAYTYLRKGQSDKVCPDSRKLLPWSRTPSKKRPRVCGTASLVRPSPQATTTYAKFSPRYDGKAFHRHKSDLHACASWVERPRRPCLQTPRRLHTLDLERNARHRSACPKWHECCSSTGLYAWDRTGPYNRCVDSHSWGVRQNHSRDA